MDENKAEKCAHNADMFIGLTPYLGCQWCGMCICVQSYAYVYIYIWYSKQMQIYADICRYELRANHEFCDVLCQVTEADFSTFPLSSSFRIWSEETQASDPWAILGREIQVSTCSSYFFLFNIAFHWQMAERVFYVTSMLELMRTKTPYVLSSYDFPSSAGKKQDQRDHLHLKDSWNSLDLPPPRMPVINRNPQLNLYLPLASWVGG